MRKQMFLLIIITFVMISISGVSAESVNNIDSSNFNEVCIDDAGSLNIGSSNNQSISSYDKKLDDIYLRFSSENVITESTYSADGINNNDNNSEEDIVSDDNTKNLIINSLRGSDNSKDKPKVLFLLGGLGGTTATSNPLLSAINNRTDIQSTIVSKNNCSMINFNNYDLIFIDAIWPKTPDYLSLKERINEAMKNNVTVVTRAIYSIADWKEVGNVNMKVHSWIPSYWTNINVYMTPISIHNANNLIDYLATNFLNLKSINPEGKSLKPISLPKEGIYHPDYSNFFSNLSSYLDWYKNYDVNKPTIAICFGEASFNNLDTLTIDSLIEQIENKNINVIPYFYNHEGRQYGQPNVEKFLMVNGTSPVDLIIHYRAAGWNTEYSHENVTAELEKLNVPIVKALTYNGNYLQWVNDTNGLDSEQFSYTLTNMEIQGIFNPIVIATKEVNEEGIKKVTPIEKQVNWLVNSCVSWINLRYTNNEDKKVAIIYWSSPGKDKGATASHLDVYESLPILLNYLKSQGYNLGDKDLLNNKELVNLTRSQGLNIGIWAPGELEKLVKNNPVILVSEEKYLSWFNQLNPNKRQEVIDMWGEAPGDIMTYEINGAKYLVLPVIQFGNVIISPEPSRGYSQDQEALYHSGDVPPNHQYLAYYFWLKNDFKADALIDFGRHGTVAWLPGKSATGLDCENDWPSIVSKDMPVIYVFTVEGAESGLPKHRQNAIIISHSTPPMSISGLYGNLSLLSNKIDEYKSTYDGAVKAEYKASILNLFNELNLNDDLKLDLSNELKDFDAFVEKVHDYLEDIKSDFISNGLHVLGTTPKGEKLVYTIQSMLGYNFRNYMKTNNLTDDNTYKIIELMLFDNYTAKDAQLAVLGNEINGLEEYLNKTLIYKDYLNQCNNELNSIGKALNGGYIPTGQMGDPIINPNVYPTGKNIYSFDPRIMPTEEAWNIAVTLVDEMLKDYLAKNGKYPDKIAFMLWATHSVQDKGVMEAEIMYLMGVEPIRDPQSKYIVGTKLIENLNRPRIDVLITTTALYMNEYKYTLDILDKAVRLASNTNDTSVENKIKENSNIIYQQLIKEGYSEEEAKMLADSRIFSQKPGNHHNPLEDAIINSNTWENDEKLADSFINTFGYVYTSNGLSVPKSDIYNKNLEKSEVAMFRRYVNANTLLSGDDYAAYFGGLGLSIKKASGKTPLMLISNLENPNNRYIESLESSLAKDFRTTYNNPNWIKSMMDHGASGAGLFAGFVENTFMWDVTTGAISDNQWNSIYNTYVKDQYGLGIEKWFKENNPYSEQAIHARLMDAARKNYWNADTSTKQDLANRWAESIVQNGVSCCDCSCGNVALMSWAMQYVNPDLLSKLLPVLYDATYEPSFLNNSQNSDKPDTAPSTNITNSNTNDAINSDVSNPSNIGEDSSSLGVGTQFDSQSSNQNSDQSPNQSSEEGDSGKASEVSIHENNAVNKQVNMPIALIVCVLLILVLFVVGYYKKKDKDDRY